MSRAFRHNRQYRISLKRPLTKFLPFDTKKLRYPQMLLKMIRLEVYDLGFRNTITSLNHICHQSDPKKWCLKGQQKPEPIPIVATTGRKMSKRSL
jgi:hypothetical protein